MCFKETILSLLFFIFFPIYQIMEQKKRKPYKELSLKEKVELLKFLENNSQRAAADKFHISKTAVSNISKRKSDYQHRFEENESDSRSRKIRKTDRFEVNQATFEWFKRMRGMNARISGPLLQEAALDFAKKLGVLEFTASNGWLESFKKRHNISQRMLCGESNDVDCEIVDNFKERIASLMADYNMDDIFNADECGLFYRAMPNKTLAMSGDKCKDGKMSKERITVLLACNATGEKLKPLVIGKAKKPRCFTNVDTKKFPVLWYSNSKAWMTGTIFTEWLSIINKQMKEKNRKILLFTDNCPAHPNNVSLSNVKIQFLPPNTTSHLQPLDQGIIQAFKLYYRKFLLQAVISRCDSCKSANEIAMSMNVLDAIMWIKESWELVSSTTIFKCFEKCGFFKVIPPEVHNEVEEPLDDTFEISNIKNLIDQLHVENQVSADIFLNFDNDVPSCDNAINPDQLVDDILKNQSENECTDEEIKSENISHAENTDCIPTDTEILQMCKKIQLYAMTNCPDMLIPEMLKR